MNYQDLFLYTAISLISNWPLIQRWNIISPDSELSPFCPTLFVVVFFFHFL